MAKETSPKEIPGVQDPVVTYARTKYGIECTKLSGPGQRSIPDFLFWLPYGHSLVIEFKRLGHLPTPDQQRKIDRLRRLGYDVHVIDNKESGKRLIDDRMGGLRLIPVPQAPKVEPSQKNMIKSQHGQKTSSPAKKRRS